MLRKVIITALLTLSGAVASAANYGMAGCGLGALAFGDQPGKIQIVAGILNDIVSPQTFAITSGTSNCYEDSGSSAANKYIETNKVALQEDVARGQGETLTGLLTIWKCDNAGQVSSTLQQSYGSIYSAGGASAEAVKGSLQNAIKSNKEVATSCKALI